MLPTAKLTEEGVLLARVGKRVPLAELSEHHAAEHAWIAPGGELVAIGRIEDGTGRVVRGFTAR